MKIDRVKLIAEMARQRITTMQLAEKSGVSRVTIGAARNGKTVHRNTAVHIAHGLGVPLESILEE